MFVLEILCVEDEPDLREDLVSELRDLGHTVAAACDGVEGLALALSHRFDIILCDIRMPRLGGIELLAELRRLPGANAQTPCIMLTAYDDRALDRASRELGAVATLQKPVSYSALAELLAATCAAGSGPCTDLSGKK
ncbi:MAG: hypothetical protein RLZZ08_1681 [Pseudomonadota bacterium]|jgi:CheY-like chemotaxis protein